MDFGERHNRTIRRYSEENEKCLSKKDNKNIRLQRNVEIIIENDTASIHYRNIVCYPANHIFKRIQN